MRKINLLKKVQGQSILPYAKINIWPTRHLTKKQQYTFRKNTGFYSAELGIRLRFSKMHKLSQYKKSFQVPRVAVNTSTNVLKTLVIQNDYVKTNANFLRMPNSLKKSTFSPFLKNAALVPGAHRIRRTKSFYYVQKNSQKTLNTWLGQNGLYKIHTFLKKAINLNQMSVGETGSFRSQNSMLFITQIESLPMVFSMKTFQYKNIPMVSDLLKKNVFLQNGFFRTRWNSLKPGDVLMYNKSIKSAYFMNKMLLLKYAQIQKKNLLKIYG